MPRYVDRGRLGANRTVESTGLDLGPPTSAGDAIAPSGRLPDVRNAGALSRMFLDVFFTSSAGHVFLSVASAPVRIWVWAARKEAHRESPIGKPQALQKDTPNGSNR